MAGSARPALYVVLSASCLPFLGLRLCRSAERFYATPNVCAFVQGVDLSVRAHLGLSQVTCPGGGSGCSRGTVQVKHTPSHVLGGDIFGSSFCLFPSLQALPAALGTLCLLLTLRAKGRARRVAGPPCLSIPHIRACSQLHPPSDSDPPPPPPRLPSSYSSSHCLQTSCTAWAASQARMGGAASRRFEGGQHHRAFR